MVKVEFKDGKSCYMDNFLHHQLMKLVKGFKKDDDFVICIDGKERTGKSVLAQQIARTVDPTFNFERMCMTPDKFEYWLRTAEKGQAVVFDEAYRGLGSDKAAEKVSKLLTATMMEMGQRNLFVIIVLPTFFKLNSYSAIFRTRGLFHVYRDKRGNRGRWLYFNDEKKKRLYIYGKKNMIYSGKYIPRSSFKGRFLEQYVIDEDKYREMKGRAFTDNEPKTKKAMWEKFVEQRDIIIRAMIKKNKWTQQQTSDYLKKIGIPLTREGIKDIVGKEDKP